MKARACPAPLCANWQKLAEDNWPLVKKIAGDFGKRGADYDDVVSIGNVALVDAAQRFDPSRGVPFGAYAAMLIRQSIVKSLSPTSDAMSPGRRNRPLRAPSSSEAQDRAEDSDDEDSIADDKPDPEQTYAESDTTATVDAVSASLRARLKGRDLHVIEQRYSRRKTQAQIAEEMGISYQAVQQIEARALSRMRKCGACAIAPRGERCS